MLRANRTPSRAAGSQREGTGKRGEAARNGAAPYTTFSEKDRGGKESEVVLGREHQPWSQKPWGVAPAVLEITT